MLKLLLMISIYELLMSTIIPTYIKGINISAVVLTQIIKTFICWVLSYIKHSNLRKPCQSNIQICAARLSAGFQTTCDFLQCTFYILLSVHAHKKEKNLNRTKER